MAGCLVRAEIAAITKDCEDVAFSCYSTWVESQNLDRSGESSSTNARHCKGYPECYALANALKLPALTPCLWSLRLCWNAIEDWCSLIDGHLGPVLASLIDFNRYLSQRCSANANQLIGSCGNAEFLAILFNLRFTLRPTEQLFAEINVVFWTNDASISASTPPLGRWNAPDLCALRLQPRFVAEHQSSPALTTKLTLTLATSHLLFRCSCRGQRWEHPSKTDLMLLNGFAKQSGRRATSAVATVELPQQRCQLSLLKLWSPHYCWALPAMLLQQCVNLRT